MPHNQIDIALIKLIDQLTPSQKADLVIHLENILRGENISPPREIEMYNLELDQAMQHIKDGKYISLEELEKEMEEW